MVGRLVTLWTVMLRCPRTYSGRPSVRLGRSACAVTTVGVRSYDGRRAPSAVSRTAWTGRAGGLSRLDARHRVERASLCARPAARILPQARAGREGRVRFMARVAVRESVTLAGLAERARAARAFVSEVLGPGHPCGDVAVLLVSDSSVIVSGIAARVLPGRRSRSRSLPGTVLSGSRSPTGPGLGRRSCVLRAAMRKAAGGFSSLRGSRLGGAVDGVAGGW
jgi:hypothetical protein